MSHTKLIRMIFSHGGYPDAGRDAIVELAGGGEAALDAFLKAQNKPLKSDLHPRDLHDTVSQVFGEFARQNPDALIDRFEAGDIDEFSIYWALASAKGQRSIDVLLAGLKSKEKFCRWAAAQSLIQRKNKITAGILVESLNDRSSLVKSTIVQAMRWNRNFRLPEALPALQRMIDSKSIQKHSPGIYNTAKEVVSLISSEMAVPSKKTVSRRSNRATGE